jgi:hypothetical protein
MLYPLSYGGNVGLFYATCQVSRSPQLRRPTFFLTPLRIFVGAQLFLTPGLHLSQTDIFATGSALLLKKD